MRNEIDFSFRDAEYFLQESRGMFAHDDQTVGECSDLVHHGTLIVVRLTKNRMQSRYYRHFEAAHKPKNVAARRASEDTVLMLQGDKVDIAKVKKVGSILI